MNGLPSAAGPDRKGIAIAGFCCGMAMLLGWCIPCIGIPLGITGVVLSALGLRSSLRGLAIAGIILASIGLLVSVANAIMGAWMALNGQHPLLNG